MLDQGLDEIVGDMYPVFCKLPSDEVIEFKIEDATIGIPGVPHGTIGVKNPVIYPSECRQRASTYKARMIITIGWSIDGLKQQSFEKDMGEIPIMLRVIF